MHRRRLLELLGSGTGLSVLVGCTSDDLGDEAPSSTNSPTPSATPTAIAEATDTPVPTTTEPARYQFATVYNYDARSHTLMLTVSRESSGAVVLKRSLELETDQDVSVSDKWLDNAGSYRATAELATGKQTTEQFQVQDPATWGCDHGLHVEIREEGIDSSLAVGSGRKC